MRWTTGEAIWQQDRQEKEQAKREFSKRVSRCRQFSVLGRGSNGLCCHEVGIVTV